MYELIENEFGSFIKKENADGSILHIPINPSNADYQAYLNPDKVEHLTEIPTP